MIKIKKMFLLAVSIIASLAASMPAAFALCNPNITRNETATCCLDANRLYAQTFNYRNDTESSYNETTYCEYGCDSVLNACSPPPIVIIGLVIAGIVAALMIWKILKWLFK